ncbi:hypothetical protein C8J56DRAFT_890687 [Mycena floridula]|nr:hypothetical protein C8J56DRAFT_890687 [Mycena floridula]
MQSEEDLECLEQLALLEDERIVDAQLDKYEKEGLIDEDHPDNVSASLGKRHAEYPTSAEKSPAPPLMRAHHVRHDTQCHREKRGKEAEMDPEELFATSVVERCPRKRQKQLSDEGFEFSLDESEPPRGLVTKDLPGYSIWSGQSGQEQYGTDTTETNDTEKQKLQENLQGITGSPISGHDATRKSIIPKAMRTVKSFEQLEAGFSIWTKFRLHNADPQSTNFDFSYLQKIPGLLGPDFGVKNANLRLKFPTSGLTVSMFGSQESNWLSHCCELIIIQELLHKGYESCK